jgi:hypothetical protein
LTLEPLEFGLQMSAFSAEVVHLAVRLVSLF